MSVQRQPSSTSAAPAAEGDIETTAELPVLDVASYEAARSNNTDTWVAPSPLARETPEESPPAKPPAAAKLEVSLHALSDNLREVEERLKRKGERLAEIEKTLAQANGARAVAEQRAKQLDSELTQARTTATAAEARVTELQRSLEERETTHRTLQAHDKDVEIKLALRDKALSLVQRDLTQAHELAATYLEALRSAEGRRGILQDLSSGLYAEIDDRDTKLSHVSGQLTSANARVRDLESKLIDRGAQLAQLERELGALRATVETTAAESRKTLEQRQAEHERIKAERVTLIESVNGLESKLAEATARATERDTAARTAQARYEELEAAGAGQRKRSEQLESEMGTIRSELQQRAVALQDAGTERNELTARVAASESRVKDLEHRIQEQQDFVRVLQADSNASVARAKELEGDLRAAEDMIHRLETELRTRVTRMDELEKTNREWRTTVEEARNALTERDSLIHRLEEETANSAILLGSIQQRLDSTGPHEISHDGDKRLLIRTEGDSDVVHVLGRKTSVGRTPDNDLQIDAKFISRHHAVILAGPAHTIIEDLNSTNGVLVNGRRITRQTLKDGDSVVIGRTLFRFAVRPVADRSDRRN